MTKLWKTALHPIGARRPMGFRAEDSIKNTPDGGEVTLRLGRSEGTLKIEVVDTGIGIKPEHRDLVFMKFYRTTNSRLHSSGKTKFMGAGPGLGLYLVRGIIEAHGGSVRIEDSHNEIPKPGTKFVIQLPELGQRQETVILESSGRIITCNKPVLLPNASSKGQPKRKTSINFAKIWPRTLNLICKI